MKRTLKTKVWPAVAGLLVAFIIMTIFEYANSFFFPLPEGLDIKNREAVQAFVDSLPWTAYILVIAGWVIGSSKAGYVTSYLAKEETYRLSFVAGIILVIAAIANSLMIGHDLLFTIVTLPIFIVFTYLGHLYFRKRRSRATS